MGLALTEEVQSINDSANDNIFLRYLHQSPKINGIEVFIPGAETTPQATITSATGTTISTTLPTTSTSTATVTSTASLASCSAIPPLPDHATVTCESSAHGSICVAQCEPGYYLNGNSEYSCNSGTWEGACDFSCEVGPRFEDKVFIFSRDIGFSMLNFAEAQSACNVYNASLAVPTSKEENMFLFVLGTRDSTKPKWMGVVRNRAAEGDAVFETLDGVSLTILADFVGCTPGVDCLWAVRKKRGWEAWSAGST